MFLGAIVLATLATRVRWPLPRRRAAVVAGVAVVLGLTTIVVTWHHAKARATAHSFYQERWFGAAAAVLDRQPAGTRVALFGDQWTYLTFGARHHLTPVRLDGNGRVATTPIGATFTPGPLTVHPWTFGANLAASRIGLVVVLHLPHPGRSPEWPPQTAALEAMGNARVLFRSAQVGIWKIADSGFRARLREPEADRARDAEQRRDEERRAVAAGQVEERAGEPRSERAAEAVAHAQIAVDRAEALARKQLRRDAVMIGPRAPKPRPKSSA